MHLFYSYWAYWSINLQVSFFLKLSFIPDLYSWFLEPKYRIHYLFVFNYIWFYLSYYFTLTYMFESLFLYSGYWLSFYSICYLQVWVTCYQKPQKSHWFFKKWTRTWLREESCGLLTNTFSFSHNWPHKSFISVYRAVYSVQSTILLSS